MASYVVGSFPRFEVRRLLVVGRHLRVSRPTLSKCLDGLVFHLLIVGLEGRELTYGSLLLIQGRNI